MILRTFLLSIILAINYFLNSIVFAQVKQDTSVKKLLIEIEKLKNNPLLKKAKWGICVITADSDKTVVAYNDSTGLIPASTMKAINTAAALSILGKDYTFKTTLSYDGIIDTKGTLNGNIYIKGGGDPTLGSPRIDSLNDIKYLLPLWIKNIKAQGIKNIKGAIVGDASIFDDTIAPASWFNGDLGNYYGAGSSGLNFHENTFRIILKSGNKYKAAAKIKELDPPIPYINIINKVITGGAYSPQELWVYGEPYINYRTVKGIVPRNKNQFSLRASIPDPSFFCAYSLYKALIDSGIVVSDSVTTQKMLNEKKIEKSNIFTTFYTQLSPPLDTIMYYTNQKSINTYAEAILRILAFEKTGIGSTFNGTQIVTQLWKSKGVDLTGFIMKDGSGLSPANRVSPRQLAEITRCYLSDTLFPVFYNTLPIAGVSGTISSIFKGTYAENNLRAKSGYMAGLRAYTGYVYNKKNKLLTFGIIVNNHSTTPDKMKSMLEKIMVLISETEW
ncbi:MAG: D-alanyl-D-alanine carboxypeptidase/D-alanyl-D-alanine-endopeptidase [Bacteroidetes bacterium]|nr:D-alanyl-D-alanine carboxypeptidase/D-alanyl-D-alanine-endopeptidase [Bacteroidota bacterium]